MNLQVKNKNKIKINKIKLICSMQDFSKNEFHNELEFSFSVIPTAKRQHNFYKNKNRKIPKLLKQEVNANLMLYRGTLTYS